MVKNLHVLICSSAKAFYATGFQTLNTISISYNEAHKERVQPEAGKNNTISKYMFT